MIERFGIRRAMIGEASAPRSIAMRLALAAGVVLSVGAALVAAAAWTYGQRAAEQAYDRLLAGAAFEIAESVSARDGRIIVDLPVSAFKLLALAPEDRVIYRVLGETSETIAGYENAPAPAAMTEDLVFYDGAMTGEAARYVGVQRRFAERAYRGPVTIIVGHTTRARDALARDIAIKALWIAGAAGAALIALAWFAVRAALWPLRRIETALLARDPKDLTPVEVETPREVATLVDAVNSFIGRLARRVRGMETLIADTTHQLRTPIAALRSQAELAVDEPDPQRLRALAAGIHTRAVGLSRLADQLLNQALVIHRADAAPLTELDLRAVAARAAEECDRDLPALGAALRLDLPEEPAMARGDMLSLVEAVKNLLNNAHRHGAPPVTLSVEATASGPDRAAWALTITDRGEGGPALLEADSGPERFTAREDGKPSYESAGLGLSIVRAVAEFHGGALRFERPPTGGFRALLALPATGEGVA